MTALPRGLALAIALAVVACTGIDGLAGGEDPAAPGGGSLEGDGQGGVGGGGEKDKGPDGIPERKDCATGQQSCGGTCLDVATDAANCGRCGHGCAGGTCAAGKCQPVELATKLNIPEGLAVGPDALYVTVAYEKKVLQIPKNGGEPVVLTTDTTSPGPIATINGTDGKVKGLAWGEQSYPSGNNIVTCDLPCTTVTKTPVSGSVEAIAVANGYIYWTESTSTYGKIRKCSTTNCKSYQWDVVADVPNVHGLVVSDTQLVFGVYSTTGVTIRRAASSGAGVVDLIPGIANPTGLATDGTTIFVAGGGSNLIARCPLTGCTMGQPSSIALASNPHAVATDGANVYWTNGLRDGGSVSWCAADSCAGKGEVLAADQANPYTVAVDETAVYWTNAATGGQVMKIARP